MLNLKIPLTMLNFSLDRCSWFKNALVVEYCMHVFYELVSFFQPMMPPYGTPPYVIYPPGGIYAHPSMPPVCFNTLLVFYCFRYITENVLLGG
jgi:hypothetical protein